MNGTQICPKSLNAAKAIGEIKQLLVDRKGCSAYSCSSGRYPLTAPAVSPCTR